MKKTDKNPEEQGQEQISLSLFLSLSEFLSFSHTLSSLPQIGVAQIGLEALGRWHRSAWRLLEFLSFSHTFSSLP